MTGVLIRLNHDVSGSGTSQYGGTGPLSWRQTAGTWIVIRHTALYPGLVGVVFSPNALFNQNTDIHLYVWPTVTDLTNALTLDYDTGGEFVAGDPFDPETEEVEFVSWVVPAMADMVAGYAYRTTVQIQPRLASGTKWFTNNLSAPFGVGVDEDWTPSENFEAFICGDSYHHYGWATGGGIDARLNHFLGGVDRIQSVLWGHPTLDLLTDFTPTNFAIGSNLIRIDGHDAQPLAEAAVWTFRFLHLHEEMIEKDGWGPSTLTHFWITEGASRTSSRYPYWAGTF